MYWLMTAPPVVSTVNRKMRTVLNKVTSDTPETSASLEKLTVKVSAIPTNIRRNCSTKSDRMSPPKSLLLNNSDFIFFHKGVLAVGKHPADLFLVPVTEICCDHRGNPVRVHPQLILQEIGFLMTDAISRHQIFHSRFDQQNRCGSIFARWM